MDRITEAHIFVWRATPAIQCALRLFDSFNSETTKINYQFLIEYKSLKRTVHVGNVCLFLLRLNVQVNNISVISGRNLVEHYQYFRGLKCLTQEHNTAEVGFEPPTSHSGARRSTTWPPHSPTLGDGGLLEQE